MGVLGVVFFEEVLAKVVVEVAEDGVDVVGVVLEVVVFDEEGRAVNAVVVFQVFFEASGPGEVDFFEAFGFYFFPHFVGEVGAVVIEVESD